MCIRDRGQAYYIASFAEDSFYLDFYQKLAGELALTRALPQLPPEGVEACLCLLYTSRCV